MRGGESRGLQPPLAPGSVWYSPPIGGGEHALTPFPR